MSMTLKTALSSPKTATLPMPQRCASASTTNSVARRSVVSAEIYEYDRFGRVLRVKENNDIIEEYEYNSCGNLSKTRYCESYIRNETYDIKGALQNWSLNRTDFTPILSQTLTYGAEGGSIDWVGRITAKSTVMTNSVNNPNPYGKLYSVKYDYHYSKGGFLDQATFIDNSSTYKDYSTSYAYDRQGNLKNIVRYGKYFEEEYLDLYSMDIERNGNMISDITVDDLGSVPMESQPIPLESEFSFKYDSNGNRTADPTRGIDDISWNWNNKPTSIWFGDAESLHYTHSVSGERITSKYSIYGDEEDIIETSSNINSFEYINRKFNRRHYRNFYTDSIGVRHLMVPDYQGNIIAVINLATNKIEQFTDYYPYGLPHASSVSPQSNRYKFEGKELTTEGGAYLANFEARLQSPFLGDFLSPDPKAEEYLSLSPWAFCAGDPINYVDPTGERAYVYATELPGTDISTEEIMKEIASKYPYIKPIANKVVEKVKDATHTFISIESKGKEPEIYAYGSEIDGIKGAIGGKLTQCHYYQDKAIATGGKTHLLKRKIEVSAPNGMTQEQFENSIRGNAKAFANDKNVTYFIYPYQENTGNCNSSTSTLLLKSGVSGEEIDRIGSLIPGIVWGWSSKSKAWSKPEVQRMLKRIERNAKRFNDLYYNLP